MYEELKNGQKDKCQESPSDVEAKTIEQGNVDSSENTIGGNRNNNVTMATNDGKIALQVDLSLCCPKSVIMNDLNLQLSAASLMLVAQQCTKHWSAKFPHPVDVGSVSTKFRRKQQMLEVVCLQKLAHFLEMIFFLGLL